MHSERASLLDADESTPSTGLLNGVPATQSPAPAVSHSKDELAVFSSAPPVVASTEAPSLERQEEDKPTRSSVDVISGVCESASMPFAADDVTQFRATKGQSFLVHDKGLEPILGDSSRDFLPLQSHTTAVTPEELQALVQNGENEGENRSADASKYDDAARSKAIQDKYSVTSEWVESLPLADLGVIATEAVYATAGSQATPVAEAVKDKRRRRGESAVQNGHGSSGGGEYKRRAQERAETAELQAAFKHSQRALRKQARSVNMREVFSRTIPLPAPLQPPTTSTTNDLGSPSSFPLETLPAHTSIANGSASTSTVMGALSPPSCRLGPSVFSHTSCVSPSSPSNSSGWSPSVAGELTNQFLTRLQQQRRQKFEKMVSRELTQTQTWSVPQNQHPQSAPEDGRGDKDGAHSPHAPTGSAATNAFTTPVDELVIAEEDNEAANWLPVEPPSPATQNSRRVTQVDAAAIADSGLLGASSSQEGRLPSFPTTPVEIRKTGEEEEGEASQHQDKVVKSLARKHEIWKLKQRQLRAQEQVELDERAKAMQQPKRTKPVASLTSSAPCSISIRGHCGDADLLPASTAKEAGGVSAAFFSDVLHTSQISATDPHRHAPAMNKGSMPAVRSISSTKLSPDDISMIRRINSFENSSAQRVAVFCTATAKQKGGVPKA
ncbi:hypothetical protein JKF63_01262 [Porcisia hertigi]|uniref:Uncharacterized protein n=1 Tax=Porcisia hertigi TaxID=2761500 RepID=A0A836L9S2_9TRYP|nr:hypothetical protein JKF63_01262 [Porcisia hertigi]